MVDQEQQGRQGQPNASRNRTGIRRRICPARSDPEVELAPVKRVAIIAEAFLPKVDGVAKTAWLTLRYLQQTGREVLVFAPDTAPPAVGNSEVVALPSLGLIMAPESRMALPQPGGRQPP